MPESYSYSYKLPDDGTGFVADFDDKVIIAIHKSGSYRLSISYNNDNNIESDKIQIHECEMHYSDFESKSEEVENIKTLENVACSLRSDSISDGDILAYTKSRDDGEVWFGLLENKKEVKNKACYYLPDFEEQSIKSGEGKLDFYIIINDPELPDYDDKYETVRLPCPYGAKREIVHLGKKS